MQRKITVLAVFAATLGLAAPAQAHHRHSGRVRHHHAVRHHAPPPGAEYVGPASSPAPVVAAPTPAPDPVLSPRFPTYDNVGPRGIGDCQFAAAADWEIIQLGRTPPEAEVIADFHAASSRGEELWDYWPRYGIDGVYAKVETSWPNTDANLLSLLATHHAVIAQITVGSEYHAVVVAGSNAMGPLLATWGEMIQWTWEEWDARKQWVAIITLAQ